MDKSNDINTHSSSKGVMMDVPQRTVKSFVLRQGRLTAGQRKALETLWPKHGLDIAAGMLQPEQVFGRAAPLVLEIGFGNGASLAQMAKQHQDWDFIGIEVHRPGVGQLLHLIESDNVRVFHHDAVEVLQQCIPDNSLDRVLIFFADPWPKKRHHKRRLVQADFLKKLQAKLKSGGVLHLATDWQPYAEHMIEAIAECGGWHNQAGDELYVPRPEYRPLTKFEQRGKNLGHGVWDIIVENRRA